MNRYLPAAQLTREQVEFFYAGLRPLVDDGSGQTYNASRRSELVDHGKDDGVDGLFSALGGKWTTSRELAETITDALVEKTGQRRPRLHHRRHAVARRPLRPFGGAGASGYREDLPRHRRHAPSGPYVRRAPAAGCSKGAQVTDLAPLGESGDTLAQVAFAVREEMALTLEDVVMRRTWLGQFGPPPQSGQGRRHDGGACWAGTKAEKLARNGKPGAALSDTRGGMTAFVVVNPSSANGRTRPRLAEDQAGAGKRLPPDARWRTAMPAARPRGWCATRCRTAIWTSSRWAATAPSTKR